MRCPATGPGGVERVLLARPRLLDVMCRAVRGPRTVLSAPAGFGKTVLVRQWAAQHVGPPLTSVTLRPGDDAPRVAARLVAAAARLRADVGPGRPGWIPASGGELGPAFLEAFSGWLSSVGEAILVLDAYDAPRDPSLAGDLDALVRMVPSGVHVVVTRRSRPPEVGPVPARTATTVVDAAQLAFTGDEAWRLVRQISGRDLGAPDVDALMRRTAGWPVGVKVAATALRGAVEPRSVVEALGSERQVAAFLREEVLDRQPLRVRRFLVRTSVLDTLDPALCRAVTGEHAAGLLLHVLEHEGAVERRDDGGEESFAHHGLLRDVLRRELHVTEPGARIALQVRAAAWHSRCDQPERAVPYLREAEQWDGLLELLDRHGPSLFEQGAALRMVAWLDAVPPGGPQRRTQVGLRLAYALTMAGATRRAEQVLRDLERFELSPGERVIVSVLRATWAFHEGPPPKTVIAAADAALEALDGGGLGDIPNVLGMTSAADLRTLAAGARALALWHAGDVEGGRLGLLALAGRTHLYTPWRVRFLAALALLEAWDGNLRLGQRYASRAFTVAAAAGLAEHPTTIDARLAVAHVHRSHGDLAGADELLQAAHATAGAADRPSSLAVHAVERALWYLAAGQTERGLAEARAHDAEGSPAPLAPIVEERLQAAEVALLLAQDDLDQAARVLRSSRPSTGAPLAEAAVHLAVLRHDLAGARAALERWSTAVAHLGLEHELWTAVVELEEGHRAESLARAARVLTAAQKEGRVRLFLDAGRPAERLLKALARVAPTPWVHQVLDAAGAPLSPSGQPGLGLSQREQEVVRFLPTPLSCAEIAGQLYISLNTLKTHLRTIYRKLGVSGRPEAIRRAEELGIA